MWRFWQPLREHDCIVLNGIFQRSFGYFCDRINGIRQSDITETRSESDNNAIQVHWLGRRRRNWRTCIRINLRDRRRRHHIHGRIDDKIQASLFRVASSRLIVEILNDFEQRHAVELHLVESDSIELVLNHLPTGTSKNQIRPRPRIRVREGGSGKFPGLLDFQQHFARRGLLCLTGAAKTPLRYQIQIVVRRPVLGFQLPRLLQQLLRIVQAARFEKQFAVLSERGGLQILRFGGGNLGNRRLARQLADQFSKALIVLLLELLRSDIGRIHLEGTCHLDIGLAIISPSGSCLRQFEAGL
ncbi:MAG TPA: hypothetical protein DCE44_13410 [Verrucomicrobiales bacterium]|nr:hypothetical protein [Verrucomicrobiales bacterium]